MELFYEVSFIRLSNFPSLSLICDGKKSSSFSFFPSIDLSFYHRESSDFEINEFYLTSESEVTYFIHLKPIMCIFYVWTLAVSLSEVKVGQRRGLLHAVLYVVLALKHWKPLLLLIIITEVWRWPRTQMFSSRWKDLELCIPLIFVNAKCILSGDLRFHIIMHQKSL